MASQIENLDSAVRPDTEPESWHKQEIPLKGPITSKEQIPKIAYPVEVEPYPQEDGYIIANNACTMRIVARHPDHNIVLGSCSPEYIPFGNDKIFDRVQEAFAANDIPANLVFALTMKNGQMVSYSYEIPQWSEFFAGGRPHKMYACFSSSHNKTQALRGMGTFINVLCANTHRAAINGEKHGFDFNWFHNKVGRDSFDQLIQLIDAVKVSASLYSKLADQMAGKTINTTQAQAIAMQILAKNGGLSTQTFNASEEIARLFKHGIANNGDDVFDLFNAVTQHFTHGEGVGSKKVNPMKKLYSSEFGSAADKKEDFLTALQNKEGDLISDADLNALVASGEKLLLEYA